MALYPEGVKLLILLGADSKYLKNTFSTITVQNKQSSIGIIIPIALVALASGLFLLGPGTQFDPTSALRDIERVYRKLASEYASRKVSDFSIGKYMDDWMHMKYRLIVSSRLDTLRSVLKGLKETGVISTDTLRTYDLMISEVEYIVQGTNLFFSRVTLVEDLYNNPELQAFLSSIQEYSDVNYILYSQLNEAYLREYGKALRNILDKVRNVLNDMERGVPYKVPYDMLKSFYDGLIGMDLGWLRDNALSLAQRVKELMPGIDSGYHGLLSRLSTYRETFTEFFNDISTLINHLIAAVRQLPINRREIINWVPIIIVNLDETLLSAARAWARGVVNLAEAGWHYVKLDSNVVMAVVADGAMWINLGGAGAIVRETADGYAITIEIQEGNDLFAKLVEKYIPGALVKVSEFGVISIGVKSKRDLVKTARLLAFAVTLYAAVSANGVEKTGSQIENLIKKLRWF